MVENFDCTQFITFDYIAPDFNVERFLERFKLLGFQLVIGSDIKQVKRGYFRQHTKQYFVELKDDNFMGEFEDWIEMEKPPERIENFAREVDLLLKSEKLINVRIILTFFAEEGTTIIDKISISKESLREGLYSMSKHNFEVWANNLVLEII